MNIFAYCLIGFAICVCLMSIEHSLSRIARILIQILELMNK